MELQNVKREDLEKLIREDFVHYLSFRDITFSNIDIDIDNISVRIYLTPSSKNSVEQIMVNVNCSENIVIDNIIKTTFNNLTFDYSDIGNNRVIVLFRHRYNIIP